jgi:hypothetical protein
MTHAIYQSPLGLPQLETETPNQLSTQKSTSVPSLFLPFFQSLESLESFPKLLYCQFSEVSEHKRCAFNAQPCRTRITRHPYQLVFILISVFSTRLFYLLRHFFYWILRSRHRRMACSLSVAPLTAQLLRTLSRYLRTYISSSYFVIRHFRLIAAQDTSRVGGCMVIDPDSFLYFPSVKPTMRIRITS